MAPKAKSGAIDVIVGAPIKPKGAPVGEPDGDESAMGSKDAAVDAMFQAFEDKDKAAFSAALDTFVEACKGEGY